jgi:hypothetical protein
MALHHCPSDVVERIFVHLGRAFVPDAASAPLSTDATTLGGMGFMRTDANAGAMALALSCKRFLEIFSRSLRAVVVTSRHPFGSGSDGNTRALVSVAGKNLRLLRVDDSKYLGPDTFRALSRYCSTLAVLDLADTPGVCSDALARYVAACGRSLEALRLRSLYAGDDVLRSIADSCTALAELRLLDLDSDVSFCALQAALTSASGTLKCLVLSNLFGRDLTAAALLPSGGGAEPPAYPLLDCVEFEGLGFMSGTDAFALCKALSLHAPRLQRLRVSPRPSFEGAYLSHSQVLELRSTVFPLFSDQFRNVRGVAYGFDSRDGGGGGEAATSILTPPADHQPVGYVA